MESAEPRLGLLNPALCAFLTLSSLERQCRENAALTRALVTRLLPPGSLAGPPSTTWGGSGLEPGGDRKEQATVVPSC